MKLKVALALTCLSLQGCTLPLWSKWRAPTTPSTASSATASTATASLKSNKGWGYQGPTGPENWSDVDPNFALCKYGKLQSPIDIRYPELSALAPVGLFYRASPAEVVNTGRAIQINVNAGGSLRLGGRSDFSLVEIHFHSPSEERINGNAYPLGAHFVHKNEEGKLAVVAVFYMIGNENRFLSPITEALPEKEGEKIPLKSPFNPAHLLPDIHGFWAFMGSLTTPPCSENVRWIVLRQPAEVSESQLAALKRLYPMNARPVQPTNGRKVYEGL